MTAELAAQECERLGILLEGGEAGSPCIQIFYGTRPDPRAVRAGLLGETDPWTARWRSFEGHGQTCEMALVELQGSLRKQIADCLAEEEQRLVERQAHVTAMRMAAGSQSEREEPSGGTQ